ncbi:hypothetical protein ACLMJK_001998 [Lecanora helva]
MGPVTRVVQTGIGLVAELKAAKAEHKASEAAARDNQDADGSLAQVEQLRIDDKADIEVEETSEDDENFGGATLPPYNRESGIPDEVDEESPPPYPGQSQAEVMDVKFPQPSVTIQPPKLDCPVIIPQRRPGSKIRGFVRAYAPVLASYDIDQDAFLSFLKSFHKSSQASPTLVALTVGAGALGNVPEPGSMLAGLGLSLIGGTAIELQSRQRANTFLDKANDEFFKPRNLYCLVMCFRPDDVPKGEIAVQKVDTSKDVLKWLNPPTSGLKAKASRFRDSSGLTRGETALPESAPLIYPDTGYAELGRKREADGTEANSSAYSKRKVVQTYFDKRAQAKYAYNHPESALATETPPKFASKYGDPTHPTVTTSHYGRMSSKVGKESLEERQARKRAKAMEARNSGGRVRRILQDSVLYLMIVNLPTEKQIEAAKQATQADLSRSSSDLASSSKSQ